MDQQTLIELSKLTERLVEDRFYELALSEIEENSFDTVAKAKAFEEAEGEEKKSRAFYVKHRVRRMKDELAAFILTKQKNKKAKMNWIGNKLQLLLIRPSNWYAKMVFLVYMS